MSSCNKGKTTGISKSTNKINDVPKLQSSYHNVIFFFYKKYCVLKCEKYLKHVEVFHTNDMITEIISVLGTRQ